ncbi:MAG: ribose-phosphate pyrophosphokinase [Hyphomicrobiales bacterium]
MANPHVSIFAGRSSVYLAEKIAKSYGCSLGKTLVTNFSDGEFQPSFEENLRGRDVFIVQSTFAPADNLLELLMMIDAARRASAKSIVAVIPYFGLARQDRKDKPRVSIGAKLKANLLTAAGVNRIVTIDLHADQLQGFFDVPVDHLYASSIFVPYLQSLSGLNLTMASPDTGGTRRAAAYAKHLGTDFVICYKQRSKPNEIAKMSVIGNVEGRDIVLIDDIIDTAGTITKAAEIMMENGASSVRAICTHPVFSGKAIERLENSPFTEIITTDTIPMRQECDKVRVISCADLFSEVINRVENNESISSLFHF